MKTPSIPYSDSGLTLLEVLVVVAVIAIAGSGAVVVTGNIQERVRSEKLEMDVATINRAIGLYEGHGGTMQGVNPHPWYILGQLKSKVADDKVDETVGLTGRFIDSRLQPVFMSTEEIASEEPRAAWDPAKRRFVVTTDNLIVGPKIKAFKMTDDTPEEEALTQAALSGIDARDVHVFGYAKDGKWVWDYEDAAETSTPGPTGVTVFPGPPTTPPAGPPGPAALDPPTFSIAGGGHALAMFPFSITLGNPNSPAISQIYYWTTSGSWMLYDGTPIPVMPGTSIHALAKSLDESAWDSSVVVHSTYDATPVTLEVEVFGPVSVTWNEVGGAVQPGGPDPTLAAPAQIGIANAAAIPDIFENSSYFTVYWTTDGSDPSISGTRFATGAFAGGFPGQSQDILLADWGTGTSFVIQAVATSLDTSLFGSSGVTVLTVGIDKTVLRSPSLSDAGAIVTIDLDTSFGDMPVGARIFYTLDGTDPQESAGVPVSGIEYTMPFSVKGNGIVNVPVRARVFGPAGMEHWFTPSGTEASVVTVPPPAMNFWQSVVIETP